MAVRIDRTILMTIEMQLGTVTLQNVLGYKYAGTDARPTGTDLANLGSAFWTAVGTNWRGVTSDSLRFVSIRSFDISPLNTVVGEYTIAANTFGTETGDILPSQMAAVISWRTGRVGPSGRGRTYVGGLVESQSNGNAITNGAIAELTALAGSIAAFSGTSVLHVVPVVVSRQGLFTTQVINAAVDTIFDVQRRRQVAHGI